MLSRTLGSSLLLASLLLPAGVVAQDEPGAPALGRTEDGVWAVSDDGQLFAAIDHRDQPPDIYELGRDDFPALVKDLGGTNQLYGIGGDLPPDATIRVARIHRREDLPTGGRDGLPIAAYARIGDDGAAWGSQQQIISSPPPCDADATSDAACLDPAVTEALATAFTAAYTPDGQPAPFLLDLAEGRFVSSGVLDEPGTIVSFAGTSTVTTRLRPRPAEGTLVVRGAAAITRPLGGRLSAWDATILELPTEPGEVPDLSESGCCGDLEERIVELEATTTSRDGDDRRELTCPPSGHGLVISQFLLDGVGRGIDTFGRKRIRRLTLTDDLGSADLTTPVRDIFGKAYRVDASESTQGNCPDVDLPELADSPILTERQDALSRLSAGG